MTAARPDAPPAAELLRLLDAVPVPLFLKNAQGHVLFLNQAWHRRLGLGHDALAPHTAAAFFTPQQMERFAAQDRVAFAQGYPVSSEDEVHPGKSQHVRHLHTTVAPVYDTTGAPQYLVGTTQDVTETRQREQQAQSERALLEKLASQADLCEMLDAFLRSFEATFAGVHCSVLLLDSDGVHVRHGAAPSLPAAYCRAIDGLAIGEGAGSCGTAAYRGQPVLVDDIANDPLWADYRDLALDYGLRACWSIPIRSADGRVLGTFGNYYREVRHPTALEQQLMQRSAYLLGLAIERDQHLRSMQANQLALEEASLYRQAILDSMVDSLLTVDIDGHILSHNNAASSMLGLQASGQAHLRDVLGQARDATAGGALACLSSMARTQGQSQTLQTNARHANRTLFPVSVSLSSIPDTQPPRYLVVLRDITQQRHDEEEIRRLAFYDPLTGLPNRRLLIDRVRHAIDNASRLAQSGALMFLDLDNFKVLNDTLGHDVGDELLQHVAQRLCTCTRDGDSVARLGGDEFVVLLEGLSADTNEAATQAETVAHKILHALGQPYRLRQHCYRSTPSIGIAMFQQAPASTEELLKKADVAMYQAKSAGRNTYRFFDPLMQAAAARHAASSREIHHGLQYNEFTLHYQPQVDTRGRCLGAEALVRWNHTSRGVLAASQFMRLAEETGVMLALGQWVLETACQQLHHWSRSAQSADWTLAVNVSASQLAQAEFVLHVANALHTSCAPAHRLQIDITESALLRDTEGAIQKMKALQAMGVRFALDDFGTGYSSLSALRRLPLSQLKIAPSFVHDLHNAHGDSVLARTVVVMGHNLGLSVVAEGVETQAQHTALANMGCDAFQGYLFGAPGPQAYFGENAIQTR